MVELAIQSNPFVNGMCTLDTLIFCNNSLKSIKEKYFKTLLDSFKFNYRLASIRFSLNQIASPTATYIFSAVTGSRRLKTLNLDDNIVGDAGMVSVTKLLQDTVTLTTLSLENNRVSDEGMLHICRGKCACWSSYKHEMMLHLIVF